VRSTLPKSAVFFNKSSAEYQLKHLQKRKFLLFAVFDVVRSMMVFRVIKRLEANFVKKTTSF